MFEDIAACDAAEELDEHPAMLKPTSAVNAVPIKTRVKVADMSNLLIP
jgi:hypothetical protein